MDLSNKEFIAELRALLGIPIDRYLPRRELLAMVVESLDLAGKKDVKERGKC